MRFISSLILDIYIFFLQAKASQVNAPIEESLPVQRERGRQICTIITSELVLSLILMLQFASSAETKDQLRGNLSGTRAE